MSCAIHALAPLDIRARASDSEEASTKKLVQPMSRSNSLQVMTPMRGMRRKIHASSAGTTGCQPCIESVSHRSAAPTVIASVRTSRPDIGWTNFFVLAASLSLARALTASGATEWIAQLIVQSVPQVRGEPFLVVGILLVASVPVRMLIPNITGFLATTIPIAMSIGATAGVNPVICGLAVMIAGDAVLYYPAQSASSLAVYERGYLSAPEIFRFGVWMTLIAFVVVLAIALPYWRLVGEPLKVAF